MQGLLSRVAVRQLRRVKFLKVVGLATQAILFRSMSRQQPGRGLQAIAVVNIKVGVLDHPYLQDSLIAKAFGEYLTLRAFKA